MTLTELPCSAISPQKYERKATYSARKRWLRDCSARLEQELNRSFLPIVATFLQVSLTKIYICISCYSKSMLSSLTYNASQLFQSYNKCRVFLRGWNTVDVYRHGLFAYILHTDYFCITKHCSILKPISIHMCLQRDHLTHQYTHVYSDRSQTFYPISIHMCIQTDRNL